MADRRKTFDVTLTLAIWACVILAPIQASATTKGLSISVLTESADYDAVEYRFGAVFDQESGSLTGPSVRAGYSRAGWHIGLLQRNLSGLIYYQGQALFGLPIQSRTKLRFFQVGLATTYQFQNSPVFIGLAWRKQKIDRYIEPTVITQALHETLRQTEWGPILGARWYNGDKMTFYAQLITMVTTSSTLTVDFLGSYDPGELTMPRNRSYEVQYGLHYRVTANYSFFAQLSYQQFSPAASPPALLTKNGTVVGSYNYPGSNQGVEIISTGVYLHW